MTADISHLIAAEPFVPFTIHTAAGAHVRIPAVDHIAVAPSGGRIVVFKDDGSTILVSALIISRITVHPEAPQFHCA